VAHLFGAHTVDTGGIDMAVRRADAAGMDALQIFTAIPKFYGDRSGIRPERAERFREALAASRIEPRNVIAHGAYLLGVATSDEAKWKRAAGGLAKEMERSTELGLGGVCFHPGTAGEGDGNAAAKRVARAMTAAFEGVEGGPRLLVENTAGAGRTYGRTPEEVGAILDAIPDRLRERTGYGLDTAHLFASGYDLRERQVLTAVLDAFEEATGEAPAFFHLNDSEGAVGSNRDRHALIGEGEIGAEPFGWLLADPRSQDIPLILETPRANDDIAADDASPDDYDIRMLKLLREMASGA
jgi:deoxyribonuclease IV